MMEKNGRRTPRGEDRPTKLESRRKGIAKKGRKRESGG